MTPTDAMLIINYIRDLFWQNLIYIYIPSYLLVSHMGFCSGKIIEKNANLSKKWKVIFWTFATFQSSVPIFIGRFGGKWSSYETKIPAMRWVLLSGSNKILKFRQEWQWQNNSSKTSSGNEQWQSSFLISWNQNFQQVLW